MEELHGILTTYEMRKDQENLVTKEKMFKAYKKRRRINIRKSQIQVVATTMIQTSQRKMKKWITL